MAHAIAMTSHSLLHARRAHTNHEEMSQTTFGAQTTQCAAAFQGVKVSGKPSSSTATRSSTLPPRRHVRAAAVTEEEARLSSSLQFLQDLEFDVVVVGAGVVGLTVANRVLQDTAFSVAVVDAKQPCAGATGAGQGYVWMNHRTPASKTWGLAHRGKVLWEQLVADLVESGEDPLAAIGWQNTGSLLVATSAEEAGGVEAHVQEMAAAGVDAEFLTAAQLGTAEPSLKVGHGGGAAFVPGDSQIDAALAVALIRKRNAAYRAQGRYMELFDSPVERLHRSSPSM